MSVRKKTNKIFPIIIIIVCIGISIFYGKNIPFSIQKTLSGVMSGISSILFGVLGIWIGIMAPDSLRIIYSSESKENRESSWKGLESLYRPVFISLFVFIVTTSFSFIGEILKLFSALIIKRELFRAIGFGIIIISFVITIYLAILAVKPGIEMLANSYLFVKKRNDIDKLTAKGRNS